MKPVEKFSPVTLLKISVLFALLIIGVFSKPPKQAPKMPDNVTQFDAPYPLVVESDTPNVSQTPPSIPNI